MHIIYYEHFLSACNYISLVCKTFNSVINSELKRERKSYFVPYSDGFILRYIDFFSFIYLTHLMSIRPDAIQETNIHNDSPCSQVTYLCKASPTSLARVTPKGRISYSIVHASITTFNILFLFIFLLPLCLYFCFLPRP